MREFLVLMYPTRKAVVTQVVIALAIIALPTYVTARSDLEPADLTLGVDIALLFGAVWPSVVAFQVGRAEGAGLARHYLRIHATRARLLSSYLGFAAASTLLSGTMICIIGGVVGALLGLNGAAPSWVTLGYLAMAVVTSLVGVALGVIVHAGVLAAVLVLVVGNFWDSLMSLLPDGVDPYLKAFTNLFAVIDGNPSWPELFVSVVVLLVATITPAWLLMRRRWY